MPFRVHCAAGEKRSVNVTRAMAMMESRFQLPKEEGSQLAQFVRDKGLETCKQAGRGIAIGLIVWFDVGFAVGWIVRGFAGTPMKDSKA